MNYIENIIREINNLLKYESRWDTLPENCEQRLYDFSEKYGFDFCYDWEYNNSHIDVLKAIKKALKLRTTEIRRT